MLSTKTKAQIMLVATFILGLIIGATGYHVYISQFSSNGNSDQAMLKDLSRTLELNDGQKEKIEEILKQSRGEYQELRNKNRPDFHAVRDRMRQKIKDVLSPDQQSRYDEWNRQQDEKRRGK